ncbi:MAG: spermidine synthase [Hyphomicrobiales bacterium]|nr:MAG: spermidine synthase [Hyphomicrobiales bacterium]
MSEESKSERWITETLYDSVQFSFKADQVLFEDHTEHQDLVLFQNKIFGKVLMLDGVTQVTSRDEFVYHEMMAHVPLLAHGNAASVLIVGGGDCGLAEEVLKHKTVSSLVQVEIDAAVVDFSKTHFCDFNQGVIEDSRFELVIDDGVKFVADTARKFDVVLVDSTDPIGPGAVLFTPTFYASIKACLNPGGVLVTQNGVPFYQPDELSQSIIHFSKLFSDAFCYIAAIPTYIGGHMALGWATDDMSLRTTSVDTISDRFECAGFETRYYTPQVHQAAFALPRFIQNVVDSSK